MPESFQMEIRFEKKRTVVRCLACKVNLIRAKDDEFFSQRLNGLDELAIADHVEQHRPKVAQKK